MFEKLIYIEIITILGASESLVFTFFKIKQSHWSAVALVCVCERVCVCVCVCRDDAKSWICIISQFGHIYIEAAVRAFISVPMRCVIS